METTGENNMGKALDGNLTHAFAVRVAEGAMVVKEVSNAKEGVDEGEGMVTSTTEWTTGGETLEEAQLLERKGTIATRVINPRNVRKRTIPISP